VGGEGAAAAHSHASRTAGRPALAPAIACLARLRLISPGKYEGRTIKALEGTPSRVLGIFRAPDRLTPTDRRAKAEWRIPAGETLEAETGEIVLAEPLPGGAYGLKSARIVERLGAMGDARSVSLICIHAHLIPQEFSAEALTEAQEGARVPWGSARICATFHCLTIDGEDARDFDDAVLCPAGRRWHYADGGDCRRGALRAARQRVGPGGAFARQFVLFSRSGCAMLPEDLSNGWCSLRPNEDRGCLFVKCTSTRMARNYRIVSGAG